jgi:glycosyltransferase involved in cell wall biosynthesis
MVTNCTHYHQARLSAFRARSHRRCCIVELSDVDSFDVLVSGRRRMECDRYTLFANTPVARIGRGELRRKIHSALTRLSPAAVCVDGWSSAGSVECLLWCLQTKTPAILMSESTQADARRSWWKERTKRRMVRICSAALVGGLQHQAYLLELGIRRDRVFLGYDAVDNEHFRNGASAARGRDAELRAQLRLPEKYFLACCRFEAKKNIQSILKAYALYRASIPRDAWGLVLLGDGSLAQELREVARQLGMDRFVTFAGAQGYDELPKYYGLAGALVHASTVEQWGLVVNEAMASGLPVLVSDRCGCVPELVEDGVNGFVFNPIDTERLRDLMLALASGQTNAVNFGQASMRIIQQYGVERFAEGLESAVQRAIAGANATVARGVFADRLLLSLLAWR